MTSARMPLPGLAAFAVSAVLALLAPPGAFAQAEPACPPPAEREGRSPTLETRLWLDHARCLHNLAAPAAGLREAAGLERPHIAAHDAALASLARAEAGLSRRIPLVPSLLAPGARRADALGAVLRGPLGLARSDGSRHGGGGASLAVPPERLRASQADLDRIRLSRISGEANARRVLERTRADSAAALAPPAPEDETLPPEPGDGPPPAAGEAEAVQAQAMAAAAERLAREGPGAEAPDTAAAVARMGARAERAAAEERAMRAARQAPGRVRPADMAADPRSARRLETALAGPLSRTAQPTAMDALDPEAEARRAARRTLTAMENRPQAFGLRPGWQDLRSGSACAPGARPGEALRCFMRSGRLEVRERCRTDRGGNRHCICEQRCARPPQGAETPASWLRAWKRERFHACAATTPDGAEPARLRPRCGPAMMQLRARALSGDEIQWRELRGGARDFVAGIEAELSSRAAERSGLPGAVAKAEALLAEARARLEARDGPGTAGRRLRRGSCMLAALKACASEPEPPLLGSDPWDDPSPAACVPACPAEAPPGQAGDRTAP